MHVRTAYRSLGVEACFYQTLGGDASAARLEHEARQAVPEDLGT